MFCGPAGDLFFVPWCCKRSTNTRQHVAGKSLVHSYRRRSCVVVQRSGTARPSKLNLSCNDRSLYSWASAALYGISPRQTMPPLLRRARRGTTLFALLQQLHCCCCSAAASARCALCLSCTTGFLAVTGHNQQGKFQVCRYTPLCTDRLIFIFI